MVTAIPARPRHAACSTPAPLEMIGPRSGTESPQVDARSTAMADADERARAGRSADPLDPPDDQGSDRAERAARDHLGAENADGAYQTMGAGGLDVTDRGAATADATR